MSQQKFYELPVSTTETLMFQHIFSSNKTAHLTIILKTFNNNMIFTQKTLKVLDLSQFLTDEELIQKATEFTKIFQTTPVWTSDV